MKDRIELPLSRFLRRVMAAGVLLCGLSGPAVPAVQPEGDARKTEAELQAVKSGIERVYASENR